MTGWDADGYDDRFDFVTELGSPVLDLLAATPGERVLDIGCGTGHQAAALAAAGCSVMGVDVDAAMVARARAQHRDVEGLRFVQADVQDRATVALLDVGDGFDAVLSNAALHWMTEVAATLATVRGALRPGGRFVAYQFRDVVHTLGKRVFGPASVQLELLNVPPMRVYRWDVTGEASTREAGRMRNP